VSDATVSIETHDSEPYAWTMARRAADRGLADYIAGYTGYVERSTVPLRRREVANDNVTVIISFGAPIHVQLSPDQPAARYTSFVAGLHDSFVVTEHGGRQFGVQVDLTPLGAERILGVPAGELAHRVVTLEDLPASSLTELDDRLASATDWATRFDVLDRVLLRRACEGPEPDRAVVWAWRQLVGAHGRVPVGVLADEIGWSRRHFTARFRHHVGLAPKAAARVLRFRHALELLSHSDAPNISAVAASSGYADHSHLVRDFHDLAGSTPSALLGAQLPDGGGFAG
jgi:AraC-like DNA-binding protein